MPRLGLAVVGCGASVAPLDFAVNMAFPAMTEAFVLQTPAIRWVAVCYVVTYGGLMLFFGALGDRLGHLRVFRWGLCVSALALTACAWAPAYGWLLAGRVMQGIGVALTLSCAPALAMGLYVPAERMRALSVYAAMFAAAGLLAPLLGGFSLAYGGWSGVYSFRVPIVILAWLCTPLLAGRLFEQALYAPGDASRTSSARSLWSLFRRNADFAWAQLTSVLVQLGSFTVPLILPYLLSAAAWGSIGSGAMLAIWALGVLAGSGLTPFFLRRMRPSTAVSVALFGASLGLVWISRWSPNEAWALLALALCWQGLSVGLFQVVYADQVVSALPATARGLSGSLTLVTRTVGVVAGAMVWLWLMDWLQTRAEQQGVTAASAAFAGTQGVVQWAGTMLLIFALVHLARGIVAERRADCVR